MTSREESPNFPSPPTSQDSIPRQDPDIEFSIDRLLLHRTEAYDTRAVYIQLLSKHDIRAPEDVLVELQQRTRSFLGSKSEVLLVLGDSGVGKSTFGLRLENELWKEYRPGRTIPLFIDLKTIDATDNDIIHQHLDEMGFFTDPQINYMRQSRQFILICDGYDEYHKWVNLHTKYQFNRPRQWQVKMIVSCRTQYLGPNYRNYFEPEPTTANPNFSHSSDLFEEAVIVPFRSTQIQEYVELFTQAPKPVEYIGSEPEWSLEQYMERLKSITHLMELAKNPFMLKMILDVLPSIAKTTTKMTRVELYDRFVELHFESEQRRLSNQQSSGKMDKETLSAFTSLQDGELVDLGLDFSKQLSLNIFKEQKGVNSITYSAVHDKGSWKDAFFGPGVRAKFLRQSSQLVCRENKEDLHFRLVRLRIRPSRRRNSYEFSHRSMLEYFYSCLIFDPRGNEPQLDLATCLSSADSPFSIISHPLGQTSIVSETSIIHFLAERVHQSEELQDQLQSILQLSKVEEETKQAASNAVTILVRAEERFYGADLKGIRVPGADLSGGQFDSAQLQGADLRNTALRNVWLHQADLSGSQMEGVVFGEHAYLDVGNPVQHCVFSPDGSLLSVGLRNGKIVMYDTSTWIKKPFQKHTGGVMSLSYSPSGHHIASSSPNKTVRIWDTQTGALATSLVGHADSVVSVAYSPTGHQIASGSDDKTVRLWDTETGALVFSLSGHTDGVVSVSFSPSGHQIASGSFDHSVRLWDAFTGVLVTSLNGHIDTVSTVTYSRSGHQIASGSDDKSVRLWDAVTGALIYSLNGHTDSVFSVAYSPNDHHVASGGEDRTVRLWDARNGSLLFSLSGHTDAVCSVAYSPSGHQIASGSFDKTVRLWNAETGDPSPSLSGHTDTVNTVTYSRSGHQIASGSWDHTVRLWDARTGAPVSTLSGHVGGVSSVVFSPSGHQIASGSYDKTIRLWDAQTGTLVSSLSGHINHVSSVSYSPSGHQIASGSFDETVRLWDTRTGALIFSMGGHDGVIFSVVYSPSGRQIASGGVDPTVRQWDTQTGAFLSSLSGHTGAINSVSYSPSGHQIASGSDDKTVRLWDAQTGALVSSMSEHTEAVNSVAYSPSGHQIASGSDDYSLRLWDVVSGQCLYILSGFQDSALSVVWKATMDGIYLAVGGRANSVRMWKVLEDENKQVRVLLCWRSTPYTLVLSKVSVQGVQGLSETNSRLLQQRANCSLSFNG